MAIIPFKAGDKVIIISTNFTKNQNIVGKIGIVNDNYNPNKKAYHIIIGSKTFELYYNTNKGLDHEFEFYKKNNQLSGLTKFYAQYK